jgi:hypothetical protein
MELLIEPKKRLQICFSFLLAGSLAINIMRAKAEKNECERTKTLMLDNCYAIITVSYTYRHHSCDLN